MSVSMQVEWAMKVDKLVQEKFFWTSMDCDGTKAGYDLELTRTNCRKCFHTGDCVRRSRHDGAFL